MIDKTGGVGAQMDVQLSVVVPMFNEEQVLPLFAERLRPVLDGIGSEYEVVAVDDGSSDATPVLLQRIRREWPQLRIIRLRTNCGHQAAISAGMERSRGRWVVTIDADLQDPPETIPQMLQVAQARGVDVVYGVRGDRSTDSPFKRLTATAFYRFMRSASDVDLPEQAGDFRLMSRATCEAVAALPPQHRVVRLVVPTLGFPSAEVTYRREERAAGQSKYPLSKMIRLSIDALTGYSQKPLRVATWFGMAGFVVAALLLAYAVILKLSGDVVSGWTSTVVIVAFFAALQLLCLGVLGEYVGRIYTTVQARPTYYVAHDSLDPEGVQAGREYDRDTGSA
ncbi:glycosyltransferase family 2 protein [Dermacoccaceae bacterium W4C1]